MKIAFLIGEFPKLSELFILNQITGLLDMGHHVEIFSHHSNQKDKVHIDVEKYQLIKKTHYFNMPKNKAFRILKALILLIKNLHRSPIKILKFLNIFKYQREALSLKLLYVGVKFLDKKFDIIHCHFGPNGITGSALKEIYSDLKVVTTFHGFDVNCYPKLKGRCVYNDLFKKCNLFTVNTNFTKQQVKKLGCDERKVVVLPVGINIEKFSYSVKDIRNNEVVRILTVGRLVEKKGYQYSIRALAKVTEKFKNIKYIIAGDGPLKHSLVNLASELGVKNYIKFYGLVNEDEVLELYKNCHIFLLPSVTAKNGDMEGQALVVQEAQASGIPVISTYHNGIPEGVLNGKSGFLVPEKDVILLAKKIEFLIEHPNLWTKMGRCGRKFIEEKYNISKLNKKLVEIYQNVIYGTNNSAI